MNKPKHNIIIAYSFQLDNNTLSWYNTNMEGKQVRFYVTSGKDVYYPQISGSQQTTEAYLEKLYGIKTSFLGTLYPDQDYILNIGIPIKVRYVKGYIMFKYDNPVFFEFLQQIGQRESGWCSLPLFKHPKADPYVVRFLMSVTASESANIWVGLYV
jgi:hypothetical protein